MPRRNRSAENILTLTQSASAEIVRGTSTSNVLNLTDAAEMQHKIKLVSSTLALVSIADTENILYLTTFNNLNLTQSALRQGTLSVSVESTLNLTHNIHSALRAEFVEHQLNLQQIVNINKPIHVSASNDLGGEIDLDDADSIFDVDITDPDAVQAYLDVVGLRQGVTLRGSIFNVTAINYLSLSQQAAKAEYVTASNHIHLAQATRTVEYEELISYLNLQQEAVCHKVQDVISTLELDYTLGVDGVFPRAASNQLGLRSVVSYILIDFCNYTPGIGAGSFDYTPPSVVAPTLVRRSTTVFTWPYTIPVLTLGLRNPDMDNVEQFESTRINRRTRGGTLDLFRDESWPKVQRLIFSFSWLCEETRKQRSGLFEFLERSIGQEIGILDFESRQWRGVILTPSTAISEPKFNGFAVSLQFEGELVP
ncbi:hypothetical protein LCGC14_1175720 [marine sediment metagenome]|uniref:Uncharacterized protein n=1 Tax=marine sediment metagenome TaxID=412755 RepID=A0A0F9LTG0_9ZZZZ